MNKKIARYLMDRQPETPCLVVDLDIVADNYRTLRSTIPLAEIFYAVKANPAPEILCVLRDLGSSFDGASIFEIESCLEAGVLPERLSFGSTIKKSRDIAAAHAHGVRLFAFDSAGELDKIAMEAPGARVYCRILMEGHGADWPLSDKFGCDVEMAAELLLEASRRGLDPYGVSFHVGSQQCLCVIRTFTNVCKIFIFGLYNLKTGTFNIFSIKSCDYLLQKVESSFFTIHNDVLQTLFAGAVFHK